MTTIGFEARRFEVHPDEKDERDALFECSAADPPVAIPLDDFMRFAGPVFDQGVEPSCTGMALAGVANYMMRRHWDEAALPVSPRMMYEMARRHDHLRDDEEGSTPRGAVKGWSKHGVCSEELWPYAACRKHGRLTFERVVDAARRLMRSYERVDASDLDAMKWAIAEFGAVFVNAYTHEGWDEPAPDHVIPPHPRDPERGGHAFMIVGYDERGFWVRNSWAATWGRDGCAVLTYDDWLENGLDVWAVTVDADTLKWAEQLSAGAVDDSRQAMFLEMWPHVVVIGDDGRLTKQGTFAAAPEDLVALVEHFEEVTRDWETRRIALIAGAGLTRTYDAAHQVAAHRAALLEREIYPVFLLWKSEWLTPLVAMLEQLAAEGGDGSRLPLADRLERTVSGSLVRNAAAEVRRRGELAVAAQNGAGQLLVDRLVEAYARDPFEIHLVAHGVGDVVMSRIAVRIAEEGAVCGATIDSCTLWAPATSVADFDATYRPLLKDGKIEHMGILALDDAHERTDSVGPYERSVLYLIGRALRGGRDGDDAVLGMQRTLDTDDGLRKLRKKGMLDVVIAPTGEETPSVLRSGATSHGGFITDQATIEATVGRILGSDTTLAAEIESRDPLVRSRALHRAKRLAEERRGKRREAIEDCEECQALRKRAELA